MTSEAIVQQDIQFQLKEINELGRRRSVQQFASTSSFAAIGQVEVNRLNSPALTLNMNQGGQAGNDNEETL